MPRDATGAYTLPAGNPVGINTPLISTWSILTFNDIARALTGTLAVDGAVTPAKLSNDYMGFWEKLDIDGLLATLEPRVTALWAANNARVGAMRPFAHATVPPSWLECNGAAVSRTTYAALFARIGTTFGAGDGTTTFNLPDLREKTVKGLDDGRGVDPGRVLGSSQGPSAAAHDHTASSASAGSHLHSGTTDAGGIHFHGADDAVAGNHTHTFSGATADNSNLHAHSWSATTSTDGAHTHSWGNLSNPNSISLGGTSSPVSSGSVMEGSTNFTSSTAGAHTHTVSINSGSQSDNHTHALSGLVGNSGDHAHTISVSTSGTHSHTLTTSIDADHVHGVTVDNAGNGDNKVRGKYLMYCIKVG